MTLISSPARAWEEISMHTDGRKVYTDFVYPMIGLCALSVFVGSLLTHGWGGPQSFQVAMRECCAIAVSLFGGYFLAAYVIDEIGTRLFALRSDRLLAHRLAGYSLVVPFLLQMAIGLLPDFQIVAWLLQFYIVYVVWEGVPILIGVAERLRLRYTLCVSASLLFAPGIIKLIFDKLTGILN